MKLVWIVLALVAFVLVGSLRSLTVHGGRPVWGPNQGKAAAWRQWLAIDAAIVAGVLVWYVATH